MEEFKVSEKQKDALAEKIDRIRDTMTDLRKSGKDPFTEALELKEIANKLNLVYEDPNKKKLDVLKSNLNKLLLTLKKMGEETEEDLIKQYREKEVD